MNVAPSLATPPSLAGKGDPTAGTTTRMLPGTDGTDLPVDLGVALEDTFGQMLSRGLTGLEEAQGKAVPLSLPLEPGVPLVADGTSAPSHGRPDPIDRGRGRGFGIVVTDLVNGEAGATRTAKTVDDGTERALAAVDDGGKHDDAPAADLAAQLALVSQWAGLAKTPTPQAADGADALGIRDKLATVRGTIAATQRSVPSRAGASVADQPADDASSSFAAGSRQAFTPGERSVDVGTNPKAAVKADRPAVSAADFLRASVEPAAASGEAGAARPASESVVVPSGAFAQQIAAAVTATDLPSAASADVSAVPTWNIHEQVGTPAWSREVGQATLRIATGDLQTASLRINPEHLGPVDVQVRIDNGIAHLTFNAAHADTRQAIESSRATLDRMFSEQGLKIGDCAVGDSPTPRRNADADAAMAGQSQRNGAGRWDQGGSRSDALDERGPATTITTRLKALGLVDTFA